MLNNTRHYYVETIRVFRILKIIIKKGNAMKRKYLTLLASLLSQSAPLWGMMEEYQETRYEARTKQVACQVVRYEPRTEIYEGKTVEYVVPITETQYRTVEYKVPVLCAKKRENKNNEK